MTSSNPSGIAAQLAKDYSNSIDEVAELLLRHVGALSDSEAAASLDLRLKEVCAMTWATAVAALESSNFDKSDKDALVPLLLHHHVLPKWQQYFSSHSEMLTHISGRTAAYLSELDRTDPLDTASGLVFELLESIRTTADVQVTLGSVLTPLIAQRILIDSRFLNSVKGEFGSGARSSPGGGQSGESLGLQTTSNQSRKSKSISRRGSDAFPVMVGGSGTVERIYQIRHFKAQLISNPRSASPTEYRFMLAVAGDGGKTKLLITSERNPLTGMLLEMAKEDVPELEGASSRNYFLCVTDETGKHHNYGASPDWKHLEAFAERALQLAQQHLGIYGLTEVYRRRVLPRVVLGLAIAAAIVAFIYWSLL